MKSKNRIPVIFYYFFILIFLTVCQTGCKKFVEVDAPTTSINTKNVYEADGTAAGVLTGLYLDMGKGSTTPLSVLPGLSADELTLFGGSSSEALGLIGVYQNRISPSNSESDFCKMFYPKIYIANSAIEGLTKSLSLNPAVKKQLLGEAYFMRAFYYFYLVNLYGDIPLAITTDHMINGLLAKSPRLTVYEQIVSDLNEAENLLSIRYLNGDALTPYSIGAEERVRPTKAAASALLARVYLYIGDWKKAEDQSSLVIENSSTFQLTSINNTFLKNNPEAIWQIQSVNNLINTVDATQFILYSTGPDNSGFYLSDDVIKSFEPGDQRRTNWISSVTVGDVTYYFPFKYKLDVGSNEINEYTVVMRLAEQYLIRAEARAQQGNISGAKTDLNLIRVRAGLEVTDANNKEDLLNAILKERRVELFTEWGHRWFDLKRTNLIDEVMPPVTLKKEGVWNTDMQLYPFNVSDLLNDPNLIQNPGYQ